MTENAKKIPDELMQYWQSDAKKYNEWPEQLSLVNKIFQTESLSIDRVWH